MIKGIAAWLLILVFNYGSFGQATGMLEYGFETADPAFTYDLEKGLSLDRVNHDANTGAWSVEYHGGHGADKLNASVITGQYAFEPGYVYTVSVFAKTNGVESTLKVAFIDQPTNKKVSQANGTNTVLSQLMSNTAYQQVLGTFTVTQAMTRYIGVQFSSKKHWADAYLDDMVIERVCNVNAANAGSDQSFCNQSSTVLAGNATGGVPGQWTVVSGSATIANPSDSNSAVTNLGIGANVLRWTISIDVCSSSDDVTLFNHGGAPERPVAVSGAPTSVCAPQSIVLSTSSADAVSYIWTTTTPMGVSFPASVNDASVAIDLAPMTKYSFYKVRVVAVNACGTSDYRQKGIRATVSTPSPIAGSPVACENATANYSVDPVAGAETYTWTAPAGCLIDGSASPLTTVSNNVAITMPAGFTQGDISVASNYGCYTSAPRFMSLTNVAAAPADLAGASQICPGSTMTYAISAVGGATSYNWTVPAGCVIAAAAGNGTSIDVLFPAGYNEVGQSGSVCVSANSACGTISPVVCQSVISMVPPMPSAIQSTAGANGLCDGVYSFSVKTNAQADIYDWQFPAAVSYVASATPNSIDLQFPATFTDGYVTVTARNSGCSVSSPMRKLLVRGAPAKPAAILAGTVCENSPATFSIDAVSGATAYTWLLPANGTALVSQNNGGASPSADVTWGTGAGSVGVRAENSCGASQKQLIYVVPTCRLHGDGLTMEETTTRNIFTLWPNPATDRVTIEFTANDNGLLTLADLSGRVVKRFVLEAGSGLNRAEISVAGLPAGLYVASLDNGMNVMHTRISVR